MKKYLNLTALLILMLTLIGAGLCYSLGLNGTFLLDDFGTLPPLAQWGAVDTLAKLQQFINGGFTGPTGRPVALLSFLMHGGVWPDDAWGFLLVNILLHLSTALILFFLLRKLIVWTGQEVSFYWLPLLATTLWMLHPLHVSTVLYIVQRMAVLSALFSLLSLLAYLYARLSFQRHRLSLGFCGLTAGAVSAILALCSKENAALLPVQFLLLEFLILWCSKNTPGATAYPLLTRPTGLSRVVIVLAVILPTLVIIWYLGAPIVKNTWLLITEGREFGSRRDFTLFERLATQQRVVGDYLLELLIPKSQTAGVFQDGYPTSQSLLNPISGLLWLLVHTLFVGLALWLRRWLPLFAFGVLWFYVGHWVESGSVMLEMKFEHRNYLPAMGLAVAVAALFLKLPALSRYKYGLCVLICGLLLVLLVLRTTLWGHPEKAALVWVAENPRSTRALENAAMVYSAKPNSMQITESLLRQAVDRSGARAITVLKYFDYMCPNAEKITIDVDSLAKRLSTDSLDWQASAVFENILEHMINGQCDLSLEQYQQLLQAANSNPYYKRTRYPIIFGSLEARSELTLGDPERGVRLYEEQNYSKVPLGMIMRQALWMASYQHQSQAAEHLRKGIEIGFEADAYLQEQANDMLHKIVADIPVNNPNKSQESEFNE